MNRAVKRLCVVCSAMAICLAVSAAFFRVNAQGADAKVPVLPLREEHLPNGLRVILAPDRSAPVYAINVTYNVGSRNERPGRTGFAHLFEHMMFEGSQNVGKGEHFILVLNNGGGMNGTTNEDRTMYFEELPKNQLDLGLYLESDRMRALNITQANFENQRQTVEEERRQSLDNQPYGKAELDLDSLSYDNFAYKHSTIGSMTDLNNATVQDVADFFKTYYAPNNAVLTLVGDFDPDQALAKVKQYFGPIPGQTPPPKVDLSEDPHYGERRETIFDSLARLPRVQMAYLIPPGNTPDNYALSLFADILAQGQSSRMYQHLVRDKQLASQVQVRADARIGPSLWYVTATARPGVKAEDLEKALDDEIADGVKNGVAADELAKAKTQFLRRFIEQRRSTLATANAIGRDAVYFNDPNLINTVIEKEDAVTLDQVNAAAKKYLVRDQRTVVISLPAPPDHPAATAAGGQ